MKGLAVRALVAIALMVLFYVTAVAAIALLGILGVAFGQLLFERNAGTVVAVLALGCFAAAGVVAWSVLPRIDRFEPPGPEIFEDEHPRLFTEIRQIAEATGQRVPSHVYLAHDVNAFVAQRGGWMGIGSRRVMGIGLPLMRALQVDELRAVLAHEMGHFYGGDTRLGPWIYKTRGALARTVANLQRARNSVDHWIVYLFSIVQAPFRWFLIGFLRVSQAISRAQEYSADAVAVRAEGRRALIDGLKKTHAAALAHPVYMNSEVLPLLARGRLPEVGAGFTQFLTVEKMTKALDDALAHELAEGQSDPYDSHPPLRERIDAASALDGPTKPADARGAVELLGGAEAIESKLVASFVDGKLEPIAWRDTGLVWAEIWRERARDVADALKDLRVDAIRLDRASIVARAKHIADEWTLADTSTEDLIAWWVQVTGYALATLVLERGYQIETAPGEPARLVSGDDRVDVFQEIGRYMKGEETDEAWRARWEARGLADRALVSE